MRMRWMGMTGLALVAGLAALAGCSTTEDVQDKPVRRANPASEYCVSLGGTLEIRRETAGEAGYCHLPDGRVVEEWQLFREAHPNKAR